MTPRLERPGPVEFTGPQTSRRILFVDLAPLPGGSVQSLLLLLAHLPRDRFNPLALLTPTVAPLPQVAQLGQSLPIFQLDAGQGTAIPRQPGAGARSLPLPGRMRSRRWGRRLWEWGSIARRLWLRTRRNAAFMADLICRERIDLVHLNDALPLAEPGILAAWRCCRPSLVVVRSFTPLDHFHRLLSRLPAAGVFTSPLLQDDQLQQGARFRRQQVIPNAIDLALFAGAPDRAALRAELGLPARASLAVAAGRIMRRKGLDTFIRAVAQAASIHAHADLHALLIGEEDPTDPGLVAELQTLAAEVGAAGRIHFTGYRADIPRLLLASDLLCFVPAEPEPFGRTVIEGMAAGLPVIGGRSGAIPAILREGETGLLVATADPAAQAEAIHLLLADPARAQAMGAAGRARAAAEFSIERQVEQFCELYDDILKNH